MSTPPSSSSVSPPPLSLKTLGLGYAIAIAFGFLVLFSTLLLSSYFCCRRRHRRRRPPPPSDGGVIVPRIIFVAENEDSNPNNGVVGLDRSVINSYPKFQFFQQTLQNNNNNNNNNITNSNNNNNNNEEVNEGLMCTICLSEYKEGEMMRMMPDCKHYFHMCCLDAWLKLNGSCPVCRNSPLPTPISTPLAEVVPLSLFPDNRRRTSVIDSSSSV